MSTNVCPHCGRLVGNMQVHPDEQCLRQQETNRRNLGQPCQWCGSRVEHKDGCPRRKQCCDAGPMAEEFRRSSEAVDAWPEWKRVLLMRSEQANAFFEQDDG